MDHRAFSNLRPEWDGCPGWLTPMILARLLVGCLVIFAQSSAVAPFIYTLF